VEDWVALAPGMTVEGRPFTDPARTEEDLAAIELMLAGLRRATATGIAGAARLPAVLTLSGLPDGRAHRAVICDPRRLRGGQDLTWVGFFAEKRRDRDPAPLTAADDALIAEFPRHPGILSYSSLELAGGDWGNLILLADEAARDQWRASARHAHAVQELAPAHYTVVRLHRGVLPGGLAGARRPELRQTRYHDYRAGAVWRAERTLDA